MLEQLYEEMRESGIALIRYPVETHAAATIEYCGKYGIFMDPAKMPTAARMTGILAHEMGHCMTGATHALASPFDLVARHEAAANRWAIERCLPFERLQWAVLRGGVELWELAEELDLPEDFIRMALEFYTETKGMVLTGGPQM